MIREILQAPDERLHRIAAEMPTVLSEVACDLRETFAATSNCVGLAATQIGHLWRAIVVDVTRKRNQTILMINPVILKSSEDCQLVNDGCMSVQRGNLKGTTKRPKRIVVAWIDENGAAHKQKFSGFIAAVIHHEIDHLNGTLFTSRLIGRVA